MSIDEIVIKLTPLVKSYARDMNVLIVDDEKANVEFYKIAFGKFFGICDVAHNGQEALEKYQKNTNYYDLIVTDVEMPILNGLELVETIRETNMEQSIIVITAITDISINQNLAFYYIDGLLPKPVDTKKLFVILYRVLKKIAERKELSEYVKNLEDEANQALEYQSYFELLIKKLKPLQENEEVQEAISIMKTLIGKNEVIREESVHAIEKMSISSETKKDIRFTSTEKLVSASELAKDLDDSIFDKIEDFEEILENLVLTIDNFGDAKDESSINYLKEIIKKLSLFVEIVDTIGFFPIISRSIANLITFLNSLTYDDISTHDRGKLLAQMLLGLEDDLKKWIESIFLEQNADNVHYLDASFSNNVLEIESIFNDMELDDEDEDDLEFF